MTAQPLTPEHWLLPAIHPVYARLVCAELRRRGFSEAAITAGTRLDWDTLHSDNRFLSFEQFRRLVAHALTLSDCPWLGLEVGINAQLSLHGALGQAVAASSSVEEALLLCQRYMPLRQRIFSVAIETGDPVCIVAIEQIEVPYLREFMLGYLTATLVRLMEAVTGQPLQDEFAIEWPFPQPAWSDQYRRLATRNTFGHTQLRGKVSATLLQRRSLSADPEARRVAERECERQLKVQQQGGTLTQRIQQRLASCQGAYPGILEMAAEENVSSRTLIRHLREEGTTYQQLLDTVREELACWLLLQTGLPVEAIAERLGYEDTSNFSRTFRRWVGLTPREFRLSGTPEHE